MSSTRKQAHEELPKLVLVNSVWPDRQLKIASAQSIVDGTCKSKLFNEVPAKQLARIGQESLDGIYLNAIAANTLSESSLQHLRDARKLSRRIGAAAPGARIDAEFILNRHVVALVRCHLTYGKIVRVDNNSVVIKLRTKEKVRANKQSDKFFFSEEFTTLVRFPHWTAWAFEEICEVLSEKARS